MCMCIYDLRVYKCGKDITVGEEISASSPI